MDYPEQFLKGIDDKNQMYNDVQPMPCLFTFSKTQKKEGTYKGCNEESISWRDEEEALDILFAQTSKGKIQFEHGIVVFDTNELEKVTRRVVCKDKLFYERDDLPENKYHGNLLLKNVPKAERRFIASIIVDRCYVDTIKNPNSGK